MCPKIFPWCWLSFSVFVCSTSFHIFCKACWVMTSLFNFYLEDFYFTFIYKWESCWQYSGMAIFTSLYPHLQGFWGDIYCQSDWRSFKRYLECLLCTFWGLFVLPFKVWAIMQLGKHLVLLCLFEVLHASSTWKFMSLSKIQKISARFHWISFQSHSAFPHFQACLTHFNCLMIAHRCCTLFSFH